MTVKTSICRNGFRYKRRSIVTAIIAAIEEDNEGVIVEDFGFIKK